MLLGGKRVRLTSTGGSLGAEQKVFLVLFFSFVRSPLSRLTLARNSFQYDVSPQKRQMYVAALLAVSLPNRPSQKRQLIKSQRSPVHTEDGDPLRQAGVVTASLSPSSDGVE